MFAAGLLALAASAGTSLTPGCAGEPTLRSRGDQPARHVFQNGGREPLTLWWIDGQGKRTDLGPIAPGAIKPIDTTAGHAFVLTDPRGRCRAAVTAGGVLTGTYVGTSRYRAVPKPGWHLFIDRALEPATDPGRAGVAAVTTMLRHVDAAVPAAALAQLRRTPIFLHLHAGNGARFHQSPDWLIANGRTVELLDGIEINDVEGFVQDAIVQPWAVLHELAHGYHVKLPAAAQADIAATYRHAMVAGLYQHVGRHDGTVGPAYANLNAYEYFAELSEAWFGRNDFAPYTRAELTAYDPAGAALMARLWR